MISKELEDIIAKITSLSHSRENLLEDARISRKDAERSLKAAKERLDKALELELEIDQLQLAMRTVLNGEPSPVKVDPPINLDPAEQVGREG